MVLVAGVKDLRALPKAELHLHLPAAMRPATFAELARWEGQPAPDPREFTTFGEFERVYDAAVQAVCAHPRRLERLVREAVADAAADGVAWLQPHFNPYAYGSLGSPDAVMELVLAAGLDEGGRRGVGFGLTLAAHRQKGAQAAEDLAGFAARYAGHGVNALGLTGDESRHPAAPFARAFAVARDAGLTAAPHAGELAGPHSVREAVLELGATRVAHGVRAAQDPKVLEFLVQHGVSLDVCLTSNVALGVFQDISAHPLPALLEAGVPCSLGADDPLMFGPGLFEEYRLARSAFGLTDAQLAALARTSIETGDAPAGVKADALAGIEGWLGRGQAAGR